jgi:hypothetical protein
MTEHSFSLVPFPVPNTPNITLSGSMGRDQIGLRVNYSLSGDLQAISIPGPSPRPSRKNGLWTSTCFEFFLAVPDRPEYWEFNLSPSGDWNVFHMDSYRRVGFREESRIDELALTFLHGDERCTLDCVVDIQPILTADMEVLAGVASVIQTLSGDETYWALLHPGPQADFHSRGSFILRL